MAQSVGGSAWRNPYEEQAIFAHRRHNRPTRRLVLWPLERARTIAKTYRDWCADQLDDLTSALLVRHAPASDLIPEEVRGRPVVGVIGCWAGPLRSGERTWNQSRRRTRPPLADLTQRRPYVDHQSILDASYPHGIWVHTRGCNVHGLSDEVTDTVVEHAGRMPSERSSVIAWQLGGAVAGPKTDPGAFGGRDAGFIFNITGITPGEEGGSPPEGESGSRSRWS